MHECGIYQNKNIFVFPLHFLHTQNNTVYVYTVSGDKLTEKTTITTANEITVVAYSPNGEELAVSSGRSIIIYDAASYQVCTCNWLVTFSMC